MAELQSIPCIGGPEDGRRITLPDDLSHLKSWYYFPLRRPGARITQDAQASFAFKCSYAFERLQCEQTTFWFLRYSETPLAAAISMMLANYRRGPADPARAESIRNYG